MAKSIQKLFKLEDISKYGGNNLHVLLAEDNPLQQLFIGHMLKQLGHEVTTTGDGFETLSAIQRDNCYDVLMVNCHLPLMDGIKTAKFIREGESAHGKRLPIIGMSASATPEDCFQAGMDDFLRKPLQKLLVKAVLGRWLREKNGRSLDKKNSKDLTGLILAAFIASFRWLA